MLANPSLDAMVQGRDEGKGGKEIGRRGLGILHRISQTRLRTVP